MIKVINKKEIVTEEVLNKVEKLSTALKEVVDNTSSSNDTKKLVKFVSTVNKGNFVTTVGSFENTLEVRKISGENELVTGIAYEDKISGEYGSIITDGLLDGMFLPDFIEGDLVYIDSKNNITNIKPTGYYQIIGNVIKSSSNNKADGILLVNISDRGIFVDSMNDLIDVDLITQPNTGDVLTWNGTKWNSAYNEALSTEHYDQDETPETENTGSTWFRPTTKDTFTLVKDGSELKWVLIASEKSTGDTHFDQESLPTTEFPGSTWYKPSTGILYKYINDGEQSLWIDISTKGTNNLSTLKTTEIVCSQDQTIIEVEYNPKFIDVFKNGLMLSKEDYVAENGINITLASGTLLDDLVTVREYTPFEVADIYAHVYDKNEIEDKINALEHYNYRVESYDFTAEAGDYIFCNTIPGQITIVLPEDAKLGDRITIVDDRSNFDINGVLVNRNNHKIMNKFEDIMITEKDITLELIFSGSDWKINK